MRRHLLTILVLVTGISVLGALVPATSEAGSFRVRCGQSHVRKDDPIVYPRQPGKSHAHAFFGARSTNAYSSYRSLRRSRTSCTHSKDTAAYWIPRLTAGGQAVRGTMYVYYSNGNKGRTQPIPPGLKMIAGDASATRPQLLRTTSWQCRGRGRNHHYMRVPDCRKGERVSSWVRFPDCWDGRRKDTRDHKSHMAYASRAGNCPSSHPVPVMKVSYLTIFPTRAREGGIRLGGMLRPVAMHADFWNTWNQPFLNATRWDCIERPGTCGLLVD